MNLDTADKVFRLAIGILLVGIGALAYGIFAVGQALYQKVIKPKS